MFKVGNLANLLYCILQFLYTCYSTSLVGVNKGSKNQKAGCVQLFCVPFNQIMSINSDLQSSMNRVDEQFYQHILNDEECNDDSYITSEIFEEQIWEYHLDQQMKAEKERRNKQDKRPHEPSSTSHQPETNDDYDSKYSTVHKITNAYVPPRFFTTQKQKKYYRCKICAKAFCELGYGYNQLKKIVQFNSTPIKVSHGEYKAIIVSVVIQSYRNLEFFIINKCKIPITKVLSMEMTYLHSILFNCLKIFRFSVANTFLKFVRLTFQLGDVLISEREAINLHNQTQTALEQKIQSSSNFQRKKVIILTQRKEQLLPKRQKQILNSEQVRAVWKPQHQEMLISEYLKNLSFPKIKCNLFETFKIKQFNHVLVIKFRFYHIIRRMTKKLFQFQQNHYEIEQKLPDLSGKRIKQLLTNKQAQSIRILLCNIFVKKYVDMEDYNLATNLFKEYLQIKEKQDQKKY